MFQQAELFLDTGCSSLIHGFFNRRNGLGSGPFSSLNVSYGVGDNDSIVVGNREIVKKNLGIKNLVSAKQVHGSRIVVVDRVIREDTELDGYDGLVTNQPGLGLMIQQADCQAVLLFDPVRNVVSELHNGWRGSVSNIISKGFGRMVSAFGCNPGDMVAAISPSLGPCCGEFVNFKKELPTHFSRYMGKPNHFDFWRISERQLMDCGLQRNRIWISNICTCCHDDYFSYRQATKAGSPDTGRNCSVIGHLKP